MKYPPFLLASALVLFLAVPILAQEAPTGWKTQTRANGGKTFTPPDLRGGENYSVTLYDLKPLGGKTLEAYLRGFAGSVGSKPGQLAAALTISATGAQTVSGVSVYNGPDGQSLGVMFVGVSLDGASIRVARTLFSGNEPLSRYQAAQTELLRAMIQNAGNKGTVARANLPELPEGMTIGGDMAPGVYVGNQFKFGSFGSRSSLGLRVYIYPGGEYRICDENDEDFDLSGPVVGRIRYNRARGALDIKEFFGLSNDKFNARKTYCYYGRSAEGKPVIYGRSSIGAMTSNGYTLLNWQGPPTGRKSQSEEDAPARLAKAARDAIQTRVAPGRGVPASQIAAVIHDSTYTPGATIPGVNGGAIFGQFPDLQIGNTIANDTYLLLRDGTLYRGLEYAPDQFDIRASRRREPENWGLWRREDGQIRVSFAGKPYEKLPGNSVMAGTAQTRLSGRYTSKAGSISFTPAGRFKRSRFATKGDPRAKYTLTKGRKTGGDLAGTYQISGFALTLRYDSGKIDRMLFFPEDPKQGSLWFEGGWIARDKAK